MSCVMLTSRKQLTAVAPETPRSLEAKEKPSQAGASQQAWRQDDSEGSSTREPGDSAVPTRVPTRSMRGSARKRDRAQYGVADGEALLETVGEAVGGLARPRITTTPPWFPT